MNVISRRLIDLWLALLGVYYSLRYGTLARRMEAPADQTRRRFIVIQVDALGHDTLIDAVTRGYAPHLASLLRSGQAEAVSWYCGIPSTTPVAQAGIMFGNNLDVPGFRWYDKQRGVSIVSKNPGAMNALQQQLAAGRHGILEGGASYANMFDGGAAISLFTLSAFGRTSLLRKVGGVGTFLVLLFSPIRVARILVLSLWTYLSGVGQQIAALLWPNRFARMSFFAPIFHVLADVVVREVETFAVLIDLYRGLPSIYVTYTSYDDWAHRFGPRDRSAYRALKAIDREIAHIDRMRRYGASHEYDLYILADHGMSEAVAFESVFGESLGDVICDSMGEPAQADEARTRLRTAASPHSVLAGEVAGDEVGLPPMPSRLARRVGHLLYRLDEVEPTSPSPESAVVVRNSGPLSHVYFRDPSHQLTADEIEALFPGLIRRLAEHPGVGLVAARGDAAPVLFTASGRFPHLPGIGSTLFNGLPDAAAIEDGLLRLLEFPHSGDLVLFGRWGFMGNPDLVVSFEHQRGTHGAIGGEQCYPFVIAPTSSAEALANVRAPEELYTFFRRYSRLEPEAAEEGEVAIAATLPSH